MPFYIIKDVDGNEINKIRADLSFVEAHYEFFEEFINPLEVANKAREWRDDELLTTDEMVKISDLPMMADLLTYRQTLRDWPSSEDFPDTKPTQPRGVASLVRRNR